MSDFCDHESHNVKKTVQPGKICSGFSGENIVFQIAGITDQLGEAIVSTDLDCKIISVNKFFEKMYGYTSREVLGLEPFILNADTNSEKIQDEIYRTVSAGAVWKGEIVNRRKDGSTFPCELTVFPLKDDNGKPFAYTRMQRDISERKAAEELLRKETQMRGRLLEKLPCIAMVLERGTRRIVASNNAAKEIGANPGEFCYEKCSQRNTPCPWCPAEEIWNSEETRQLEINYRGTYYNNYWAPLTNDLYVHYIFDISDRKEAEQALRLSEEKFAKVFENSPDSVTVSSLESGRFIEVNKGFEKITGYTRDEVIGRTIDDLNLWQNPGDRQAMLKELKSKGSLRDYQIQGFNKNGDYFELLNSCEMIEIDSEPCLLSISRDVTEQNRVKNAMTKQRYYLEKAQEMGCIGTWELDVTENVLHWTDENYLIFGVPLGTAMNYESFIECVHPDDRSYVHNIMVQAVEGKPYDIEHRIIAGGKVKWIRDKAELFFNDEGKVIRAIGVTQDITERKLAEEQLEIAKEKAEAANIAKSEFLANMSHEIRTPMSVISGFSDILASEELTTQQTAYVELIRKAGKSLLVIINDILDYSKIEAGKLDIIFSEHLMADIVDVVDRMMRPEAVRKGLKFEVTVSSGLPEVIRTDQVRVHECLINLVSNAIKFTDNGFVFLRILEEYHDGELFVRFDVEDSGIGIPQKDQEHIFESFSQVEKGSTRYFGGTGLGLAITGRLAELLGGSVSVASQEGKGSMFSLVIPAGVDAAKNKAGTKKQSRRKIIEFVNKVPRFSANVLVADDHEGCRLIIRKMLERYGIEVKTASDGKEAVDRVLKEDFDLVFMDVRMPEYNGFEATEILRQKGVDVPIIALTAYAMDGDRQLCIEAGYTDYLSKPVERQKLLDILAGYAGRDGKGVPIVR